MERVWRCTRDLLEEEGGANAEARHAVLALLRALADSQGERLGVMRTVLFRYLRETHAGHAPDDAAPRFRLLHALTSNGKNIACFEEQVRGRSVAAPAGGRRSPLTRPHPQIGAFLVEWLPQIQQPPLLVECLQLVTNVVKYNASSLDEAVVHGIVAAACGVCCGRGADSAVGAGVALLEAVASYSLLPRAALRAFVATLARTVNLEQHAQSSWKVRASRPVRPCARRGPSLTRVSFRS